MENRLLNMLYFLLQEIVEEGMDLFEDEADLRKALHGEGYEDEEIDVAFGWLESYFRSVPPSAAAPFPPRGTSGQRSLRVLSFDETMIIDPEAFGFLVNLESRGLIGAETKEEILQRSMNMFDEAIGLEEMKMVTLLTIFEQGHTGIDDIVRLVNGQDLKSTH